MFERRAPDGGEIPRLVAIETTSRCNAACSFCPYSAKSTEKRAMEQSLFEKIIEDCRAFPLAKIEPLLNGEPFVDPRIVERMEHIRRRLPGTILHLVTNGNAMIPRRIDEVAAIGGVDRLIVSLNTLDAAAYRAVMDLDLSRTLDNLAYLLDPVRRRRVARRIYVRMVRRPDSTLAEQDRFLAFCRRHRVRAMIVGQHNYAGDVASTLPAPDYPCQMLDRVDILSDGRVALCCSDPEGKYAWGDVRNQSVLEVYRSAVARRYRDAHRRGQRRTLEPCRDCNLIWPDLTGMPIGRTFKTAAEFAAYLVRHRPLGRQPPQRTSSRASE
jgi:radical SAM protein with 4Fe4S-binding SPASM domain